MSGVKFVPTDYGSGFTSFLSRDVSVPVNTSYTWTYYVSFTRLPDADCIVAGAQWLFAGYQLEGLKLTHAGDLVPYHFTTGGGSTSLGSYPISLNTRYAISVVRSTTSFILRIKPDGGAWTTVASVTTGVPTGTPWEFLLINESNVAWHGGAWTHRLYEAALTDPEVDTELDSQVAVRTSNLWADYQFVDEATLTDDSSGNGRDLNLTSDVEPWGITDVPNIYYGPAISAKQFQTAIRAATVTALPKDASMGDTVVLSENGHEYTFTGTTWWDNNGGVQHQELMARIAGGM